MQEKIKKTTADYNPKSIRIGVLGSHSALEIASGAKQEGFETVVVCQKGREKTYSHYYRNIFDNFIFLDKFSDITTPEIVQQLTDQTLYLFLIAPLVYTRGMRLLNRNLLFLYWVTGICLGQKNVTFLKTSCGCLRRQELAFQEQ